jgi:hypothetical protein
MIAAEDGSSTPPRDILLDGVLFRAWTRTGPEVHTECLQVGAGDGITIRRSTFRDCHVMALFFTEFGLAGPPRNLVIENNFFDRGGDGGFYSLRFSDHASVWENVLVRNNSAVQPINVDPGPPKVNFRLVANVAPLEPWGCVAGVVYVNNVWDGVACDPTDLNAPSGFVDAEALDLHLTPGAAAVGRGAPGETPDLRPADAASDAGADQRS